MMIWLIDEAVCIHDMLYNILSYKNATARNILSEADYLSFEGKPKKSINIIKEKFAMSGAL